MTHKFTTYNANLHTHAHTMNDMHIYTCYYTYTYINRTLDNGKNFFPNKDMKNQTELQQKLRLALGTLEVNSEFLK